MVPHSAVLEDVWGLPGPFLSRPLAPRAKMLCYTLRLGPVEAKEKPLYPPG